MNDFRESLESICSSVSGAVAACLMGVDGLPVESVEAPPPEGEESLDIASLLVEYTAVLGQVRQSAQTFSAGALTELSIRSERLTTIIRPVTEEYFLALALRPEGNFGKARYLLRIHAPRLVKDLS